MKIVFWILVTIKVFITKEELINGHTIRKYHRVNMLNPLTYIFIILLLLYFGFYGMKKYIYEAILEIKQATKWVRTSKNLY